MNFLNNIARISIFFLFQIYITYPSFGGEIANSPSASPSNLTSGDQSKDVILPKNPEALRMLQEDTVRKIQGMEQNLKQLNVSNEYVEGLKNQSTGIVYNPSTELTALDELRKKRMVGQ